MKPSKHSLRKLAKIEMGTIDKSKIVNKNSIYHLRDISNLSPEPMTIDKYIFFVT
jgi:hypothetical protein